MNDLKSGARELIVLTSGHSGLYVKERDAVAPPSASFIGTNTSATGELKDLLDRHRARIQVMFAARTAVSDEVTPPCASSENGDGVPPKEHRSYFSRIVAPDADLDTLAKALRTVPGVRASYVKPASEPAINDRADERGPPPPALGTLDLTGLQTYLNAGPDGFDARYAWTRNGGKGAGVTIIDVEGAWQLSHECLKRNNRGLLFGEASKSLVWRNHGSAVLGIINAAGDGRGIIGIAPEASVGTVSIFDHNEEPSTSEAIRQAAEQLEPGDIMLIELNRPGPLCGFKSNDGCKGYIAVEWWPDDYEQIHRAVAKGIIVVQAAGNGGVSLDDRRHDTPAEGFERGWTNPFKRRSRDSGAILVGAGAPPNATCGTGPSRSRLEFSNYGDALDVQGWGADVVTCGYGYLQGGPDENAWYTKTFCGTSSASPMVVGVLACLQGYLRASGLPPLTPETARALLRSSGHPQQDAPGRPATQRIGAQPDLRDLISRLQPRHPAL